jgi:hypothetical protein
MVEWLFLGCPRSCDYLGSVKGDKVGDCRKDQSMQRPEVGQKTREGASGGSAKVKGIKAGVGRGSADMQDGKPAQQATAANAARDLVTANQLKLLLELLLMIWPCPTKQLAQDVVPVKVHVWLLLLAALLQQTPSSAKLQLLEQRGTLLLQLLYQVMLDGEDGDSTHPEEDTEPGSEQPCELIAGMPGPCEGQDSNSGSSFSMLEAPLPARTARPEGLVLLILQSLLCKPVPLPLLSEYLPLQSGHMYTTGKMQGVGE